MIVYYTWAGIDRWCDSSVIW